MFHIGKRRLGRDGPEVSAIGLGCMGMSEFYAGGSEAESIATIHHALDRGVTFLDTADMYGVGKNEELVGRAITGRRDEVFLATKFGNVRGPNGEFLGVRGDPAICPLGVRGEPQPARGRDDRPVLPAPGRSQCADRRHGRGNGAAQGRGEGALPRAQRGGAADHPRGPCGLADHRGPDRAVAVEPRCGGRSDPDGARARHCLCRLFAARPRVPDRADQVAGGFSRRRFPPLPPALPRREFRQEHRLVHEVEAMARDKGCTTAQLALAWVLAQGDDIVPIPGPSTSNISTRISARSRSG